MNIESKVQDGIENLVKRRFVSWIFLRHLRNVGEEMRSAIIDKIIMYTVGSALVLKVIHFIFRKEIQEMIEDARKVTKESLLRLVDLISKFSKK